MRKRELEGFRETLLDQKAQIVAHVRQLLDGEVHVDSDAFPDKIDTAVSESSLWLTGQMREREFGLFKKIEKSLEKIKCGDFGECEDCGEAIGLERLRARPMAEFCTLAGTSRNDSSDSRVSRSKRPRRKAKVGAEWRSPLK